MNTSTSAVPQISDDDLPALYRAADNASKNAQKQFSRLTAINLGLLILSAIVGSLVLTNIHEKTALAITSAVLLTLSIFVTLAIRMTKLEQMWYDGRAVAESVKTTAWRYMTGTDPYYIQPDIKANSLFISNLNTLLLERKSLFARLGNQIGGASITEKMKYVRNLPTEMRIATYLSERLENQQKWYGEKAESNLKSANRFFAGTIISQALAIISAFVFIIWPQSHIRFTGIFTTLITSFMTWTQLKKNDQLAQAYGLANQELMLIREKAAEIKTAEELSLYVVNSENAISREHTMWLARVS